MRRRAPILLSRSWVACPLKIGFFGTYDLGESSPMQVLSR
jgi:hypothetical protein